MDLIEEYKKLGDSEKKRVFEAVKLEYEKLLGKEDKEKESRFIEKAKEFMEKWGLEALYLSWCCCGEDGSRCVNNDGNYDFVQEEFTTVIMDYKEWPFPENLDKKELEDLFKDQPESLKFQDSDAEDLTVGESITMYMDKTGEIKYEHHIL